MMGTKFLVTSSTINAAEKLLPDLHHEFVQILAERGRNDAQAYKKRLDQPVFTGAAPGIRRVTTRCFGGWPAAACLLWALTLSPVQATVIDDIAAGDRAWAQRADGRLGSRAAPGPIQAAIDAYSSALDTAPGNLDARWKLLRAYHFKGEFVLQDSGERLELFRQGREIARTGQQQIEADFGLQGGLLRMEPAEVAGAVGGDAAVGEFLFWGAANWGLWAQYSGKIMAAIWGVVGRIRQYANIMVLMDENIEDGGGHRLLGRFLAVVPKIPIFTGWVDRDRAIRELRLSLEAAPGSLLSKIYLAEALLKFRPDEKPEAIGLLREIVSSDPDPGRLVEDSRVIEDAAALLGEEP